MRSIKRRRILVWDCCGSQVDPDRSCNCDQAKTIQKIVKIYLKKLHRLPSVEYNSNILKYDSINSFILSAKKSNDKNNKERENIVGAIINDKIPAIYYKESNRWNQMKNSITDYIHRLHKEADIQTIKCQHKGGRKFNYDFEIIINDTIQYNIELKFNASQISDAPQFVSPMKPSQYLSSSYEEYYYDNYLQQLATIGNLPIPERDTYLHQIHSPSPKCMDLFQQKYYNGCEQSSKFTNKEEDIEFYKAAKRLSNESITTFIEQNTLDIEKLSKYLQETQDTKYYMLYNNNKFHKETINMDEYKLVSSEKQAKKYRFIATAKTGNKISILLRWKNGNGIAFPAFQIS
jgi:hypothetical protein